ncbi:hypothetical protein V6N13_019657 [Hibiscus sabdariffa]
MLPTNDAPSTIFGESTLGKLGNVEDKGVGYFRTFYKASASGGITVRSKTLHICECLEILASLEIPKFITVVLRDGFAVSFAIDVPCLLAECCVFGSYIIIVQRKKIRKPKVSTA